jgi:hypothetical protein
VSVRIDTTYKGSSLKYTPAIKGSTEFISSGGVFNVSDLYFTGTPGYEFRIVFESDAIDTSKKSNADYLTSLDTNASKADFSLFLEVREC